MTPSTQPPPTRRAWVDISLSNLVANARTVREAARGASLLPMVKADGYGLGMLPVVEALEPLDPWGYGVATVAEGLALRRAGITRRALVFTPAAPEQRDAFARHDLTAVVDDPATAAVWNTPFHLEIDTGMARCGVRWDDRDAIAACASPGLEGAFTHFHSADAAPASVERQWARFREALDALPGDGLLVHASNSAGAWRLVQPTALVRPGIFLYGGRHADDLPAPAPVAALRAPVVSVRRVREGEGVSYRHEWRAPRDTAIATLGIGYADGVPRAVEGTGRVLLAGRRRPIVGRVTMDFLMVDCGDDTMGRGAVATLFGRDGGDGISVDEFAGWAGSNAYELLARLGPRLERRYDTT